jgi:apolipoprotein N-acyltransferase
LNRKDVRKWREAPLFDPNMRAIAFRYAFAPIAGGLSALAFAPVGIWPLSIAGLAILFALLGKEKLSRPFLTGWLYGLGLFSVGVSWIYVSLHVYGGMSVPLTLIATYLFCAFLALFPAWLGSLQGKLKTTETVRLLILMPTLWTLLEWVRGWIFTGFPWLAMGYSQVPVSPLAGYAPVLGVYGVSLLVAVSAGTLAWMWQSRGRLAKASAGMAALGILFGAGFLLEGIEWTQPRGEPVSVALVQGNIPQDIKWDPEVAAATLQSYRKLASLSHAQLTVLPETALPVFYSELPRAYLDDMRELGRERGGDLLVGVPSGDPTHGYLNSVASLGLSPTQFYSKHHLVPFGEFIPWGFGWVLNVLHIPMSNFSRGSLKQPPLSVAGQRIAVDICYEDVFGEEIIRALPDATLLVNVSNDAWFGDGFAARQHRQISQMRALETGRMMLRATNTGSTAIIDAKGKVMNELPLFQRGILQGVAQGYTGETPYVRWGNYPVVTGMALLVALVLLAGVRRRR